MIPGLLFYRWFIEIFIYLNLNLTIKFLKNQVKENIILVHILLSLAN